jgi:hypothetical protein
LTGLLSFWLTDDITQGSIKTTDAEKYALAEASHAFNARSTVFQQLFKGKLNAKPTTTAAAATTTTAAETSSTANAPTAAAAAAAADGSGGDDEAASKVVASHKQMGNKLFKTQEWAAALDEYSKGVTAARGMQLTPTKTLVALLSNRRYVFFCSRMFCFVVVYS